MSDLRRAARTPPEQRLLNLVVALMATQHGLTKDVILRSVSGYRQQLEAGAGRDALEKMFERDKESLRALGVPVETIGEPGDADDLRQARYRIPTADYALPPDVAFTPAEVAVLDLAAGVWSRSSLSADARGGLRKVRSLGIDVDEPVIGYSPRVSTRDAAFAPLQQAIERRRIVTFDYLRPGDDAARTRTLRPLALVEFEARWHVFGVEDGTGAERTFLLRRITGPVVITRRAFDDPAHPHPGERAVAGLRAVSAGHSAVLEVEPGSEAALRLRRRGRDADADAGGQRIRLPYVDAAVLADELASYGPEVRVVTPDRLRDQVVSRLRAVLRAHGGAA